MASPSRNPAVSPPTFASEAMALVDMLANDFDHLENIARPHDARTFNLKTWGAVRRQEELAAERAKAANEEANVELEAEMWATPAEIVARRVKAAAEKEALLKEGKGVAHARDLAQSKAVIGSWEEQPEEEAKSHLRQESSAILNSRRPPLLRTCRRPPRIALQTGLTSSAATAPDITFMSPDLEFSAMQNSVKLQPIASAPFRDLPEPSFTRSLNDNSRLGSFGSFPSVGHLAPDGGSSPTLSKTPLLSKLREMTAGGSAIKVEWRRENIAEDVPAVSEYTAQRRRSRRGSLLDSPRVSPNSSPRAMTKSSSVLRTTVTPTPMQAPHVQPKNRPRVAPLRSIENVITNHTTGLRGPMTLLHPIRGVRRINYEELYRDQFTAARDLLESDAGYMALMEHLDMHMASVKFTFNAMLKGKFVQDEGHKKEALEGRERVLTRDYRNQDAAAAGESELNPLQKLARVAQIKK